MTEQQATPVSRWAICHETIYRYSTAVVFAPHVLRLSPRSDSVRTLSRQVRITPPPVAIIDDTDDFGNAFTRVSFDSNSVSELKIESRVEVQTCARPHEPVLSRGALTPLPWTPPIADALAAFRRTDDSTEVTSLARRLAGEVDGAPLGFFQHLTNTLYAMIDRQIRVDGAAQTPDQTLVLGRGACRDLTVLYLAVCRALGVAGRFVSGYQGQ